MKLTKQRKVCAAILGLAAVAFVCDRLFLLPAGAGAATEPSPAPEEVAVEMKPAAPAPASQPSGPALSVKLQEASADAKTGRDPFRRVWIGSTKTPGSESTPAMEVSSPVEFSAGYELTSVLTRGTDDGVAMIARKMRDKKEPSAACAKGSSVGGWTLVGMDATSATFERAGMKATLELKSSKSDNARVTKR